MSEESVEPVRDLLEAFRRRDHERAFDFYDPEIEWDSRGRRDLRDAGDDVVALISRQRQWGRHSGIATELPPWGVGFTSRGGKVVRGANIPTKRRPSKRPA
jgi:hypothetical protein